MWAEVSVSHNTPVFDKHPDTQDLLIDIPVHSHRCEEAVCRPTTGSVCVCPPQPPRNRTNKPTYDNARHRQHLHLLWCDTDKTTGERTERRGMKGLRSINHSGATVILARPWFCVILCVCVCASLNSSAEPNALKEIISNKRNVMS